MGLGSGGAAVTHRWDVVGRGGKGTLYIAGMQWCVRFYDTFELWCTH